MTKRFVMFGLALYIGFLSAVCMAAPAEAPAKSAVNRFWEDLGYRNENAADKVVCYSAFNISYEKRGGLLSGPSKILERGGALSLETETSDVWFDKSKNFFNFVVDFRGVLDAKSMDKSTRQFTLDENSEDRRPVRDMFMSPSYSLGRMVVVIAHFYAIMTMLKEIAQGKNNGYGKFLRFHAFRQDGSHARKFVRCRDQRKRQSRQALC